MQHFVTADIDADVPDMGACARRNFKENEIALLQIAFGDFIAAFGLRAGYARKLNSVFAVNILREAGAIESGSRTGWCTEPVLYSHVFLPSDMIFSALVAAEAWGACAKEIPVKPITAQRLTPTTLRTSVFLMLMMLFPPCNRVQLLWT